MGILMWPNYFSRTVLISKLRVSSMDLHFMKPRVKATKTWCDCS
jgi:hypothetical protein